MKCFFLPFLEWQERIGLYALEPLQPHWQLCKDPVEYGFHPQGSMRQAGMN